MLANAHFDQAKLLMIECPFCKRVANVQREERRKGEEPWRTLCCILLSPTCFCGLVYCWDSVDFLCAECHTEVATQEPLKAGEGLVVYGPGGQSQRCIDGGDIMPWGNVCNTK
ncbi:hypothetical protein QBC40DRAFT_184789 [Triangularia verruculosa]|uniref:LITAF domain-containing protein n=1 Tax=Triangularia verruculosa TaxID=2587418 RepID=A0AAN7AP09_9PEZI|nr:hypothetical protein QBC40DRAFT_184789 [Triangularia verruculosa]